MSCERSRLELQAYFDGELDAIASAEFERHLPSCPECAAALAAEKSLRQALASAQLYEQAPSTLRRSVHARWPQPKSVPAAFAFPWKWIAVAAIVLLATSLAWQFLPSSSSPAFAVAAVDAHLRSLQPGHLTDVASTDQHTVKPWFDGKVDFAPAVSDFSGEGFPLVGGRLDALDGKSVAALVYARRKHVVNVFVAPAEASRAWAGSGNLQGYHWLAWQATGFTYLAVTDAASGDLDQLRALISNH